MESQFEPAIRMEETSEAHSIIVDLPGFRKEDLRVQIDHQGNVIISGERRVMEMEETTKVREILEKMQRGDHRFRKVVSVPENLNFDGIKAKFKDETLLITLPLLHISDQQNREAVTASGKTDQSVQSKVERSSPAGQEDSMKERSGVAHDDQRARHPKAIRQYDGKAKGAVAVEESKGLVEGRKTEAPKLAQEFVHGEPPISKGSVQERSDYRSARYPEMIQPADHKAKPIASAGESKEMVEGKKVEAPKHAQDFVGGATISKESMQERSAVPQGEQRARYPEAIRPDDVKSKLNAAAEESKQLLGGIMAELPRHAQAFVGGPPISKDPMHELSAIPQGGQSARHPEAIRPDDDKSKTNAAAKESKEFLGGKIVEVPKQARDFVGVGPKIAKEAMQELSAVAQKAQSTIRPEVIQPDDDKSKPNAAAKESKEFLGGKIAEVPKHARDLVAAGAQIAKEAMQELSAVAQKAQSTIRPQVIQPDDDKSKPNAAAKESKELLGGKIAEAPKHARDFVSAGAQIAKEAMQELSAVAQKVQSTIHPEVIQPDDHRETPSAAAEESKGPLKEKKIEALKRAEDFVHGEPAISSHTQAVSAQASFDRDQSQLIQSKLEKREKEEIADDDEEAEEADDEEDDEEEEEDEDEDEDEELSSPSDEFPERVIQIPSSSGISMFSKEKVFIASALLVLCVGLYLSYIFRSRSSDSTP